MTKRVDGDRKQLRARWLAYCIAGLIVIGAGVSLVGEAIIAKAAGNPWFWLGTAGLVVLNSGVSIFGQGVVYRSRLDRSA
jgi:hypothetical protein